MSKTKKILGAFIGWW